MINHLPIELHPAASRAWLIFESMDTSVLGRSKRYRLTPLADSGLPLRIHFLSLNSPSIALHPAQSLLLGARTSQVIRNPLYNPHRTR
jgi:hypothetical protein